MSFGESVEHAVRSTVRFRGRATRSRYWWFVVFILLYESGLTIVTDYLVTFASDASLSPSNGVTAAILLVSSPARSLVALASVLPLVAVNVRRFHDVGLSGWWYALSPAIFLTGLFRTSKGVGAPDAADRPRRRRDHRRREPARQPRPRPLRHRMEGIGAVFDDDDVLTRHDRP